MRVPTVLETTRLRLLPLRSEDTQTIHDLMYNSASVRVAEKLGFVLVRQAVVAGRKTLFFKLEHPSSMYDPAAHRGGQD